MNEQKKAIKNILETAPLKPVPFAGDEDIDILSSEELLKKIQRKKKYIDIRTSWFSMNKGSSTVDFGYKRSSLNRPIGEMISVLLGWSESGPPEDVFVYVKGSGLDINQQENLDQHGKKQHILMSWSDLVNDNYSGLSDDKKKEVCYWVNYEDAWW